MSFLYHGTAAGNLSAMQRDGIKPRKLLKTRGNWMHTVSSNKDAVYLTDTYPWHFAACAKSTKGMIIEINRDLLLPWRLCPDEDFMEQSTRQIDGKPGFAPVDWSMKKRTMHYRKIAQHNSEHADLSLHYMGTVAYYDVIPWKAVTRYVLIDWDAVNVWMHPDSSVSMMNFRILERRHKATIRWYFGDPVTPAELDGLGNTSVDNWPSEIREMKMKHLEFLAERIERREGLTVHNARTT
jgi:hypothetical protein